MSSKAANRLAQASGHLTTQVSIADAVWDPDSETFPSFRELPEIPEAPKGAAWFWGKHDNVCFTTDTH
jgi:hypothetical protein